LLQRRSGGYSPFSGGSTDLAVFPSACRILDRQSPDINQDSEIIEIVFRAAFIKGERVLDNVGINAARPVVSLKRWPFGRIALARASGDS
jgi:hypothetical protein